MVIFNFLNREWAHFFPKMMKQKNNDDEHERIQKKNKWEKSKVPPRSALSRMAQVTPQKKRINFQSFSCYVLS